jgi:magnesium chelatase family protein
MGWKAECGRCDMIRGAIVRGISAVVVEVEIAFGPGSGFRIVGLGKNAIQESRERLRHAFEASGFSWPGGSVTVNLAPADIPKEGTSLDLAIALAILERDGQIQNARSEPVYAIGELGLEGNLRPCRGALCIARALPDGSILVAPDGNRHELALLRQVRGSKKDFSPHVVSTLSQGADVARGRHSNLATAKTEELRPAWHQGVDFASIKGQGQAKRALEVVAAGGHDLLLIGPPGEGKSLLAKALPTILPKLTPIEAVELTAIYSARGELASGDNVVVYRPFRKIHHTASSASIVGGGTGFPVPGEITLAHRGVLFMDELPEFPPRLLETLRQPMEDGEILLSRSHGSARYPSEFILVAAMNPCPCGFAEEYKCKSCGARWPHAATACPHCRSAQKAPRCNCTPAQVQNYRKRISGPIMDRIELVVHVGALTAEERFGAGAKEASQGVRKRVEAARQVQKQRFGSDAMINARIPGGQVDRYCELDASALAAMREVASRVTQMTTRGHDTLLKVARTVADLNNSRCIYKKHVVEAADLCGHEEVRDFLAAQGDAALCRDCGAEVGASDRFCRQCGRAAGQPPTG